MIKLVVFLSLISGLLADSATVTWTGTCTGNTGFGFTWAAVSNGEAFKPDGKNGMMVPCDEYFEVSFSFVDPNGNVVDFPGVTGQLYSVVNKVDQTGNVVITIPPEINSFGAGFVSSQGATSNGQPFAFSCSNNVGNIKISTNYMLTATNSAANPQDPNNYIRTLDTIVDGGNWGTGLTVNPPTNQAPFQVGQTMCNVATGQAITFPFPASAAFNSITNPNPTTGSSLGAGVIAAIVISLLVFVAAVTAGVVLYVEMRRKKGLRLFSFSSK